MAQFFTSWQTWEQLVFLLACAAVLTIIGGCAKLAYTHWQVRNYATIEQDRNEQDLQRQISRLRQSNKSEDDEVPFGIRAIESGIEVEGVWISRSNTPEASRSNSLSSLHDSSKQPVSQGRLEQYRTSDTSLSLPAEPHVATHFDRSVFNSRGSSLEAVPRTRDSSRDFDLMQQHRRSQAAEIGQLTPRPRKSAPTGAAEVTP